MLTLAGFSGGRDSTAATLKYLEDGNNIDYILFCDTLEEFILMYEYIDKVEKYIGSKYGKQIIKLKPSTTFEHYTASEKGRVQKDPNLIYPLIEWNWCEGDVDKYLESIDMVNPLYKYFSRTGCAFCPHMSLRGYYIVWKFFKKTWLYMKKIERKLRMIERLGSKVVNTQWHDRYTLLELENDFILGKKNYDDTPAKDCLCAI